MNQQMIRMVRLKYEENTGRRATSYDGLGRECYTGGYMQWMEKVIAVKLASKNSSLTLLTSELHRKKIKF